MKKTKLLFLILVFTLFLSGCDKPVDVDKTNAAIEWLNQYYTDFPVGRTTQVTKIVAEAHYLKVHIQMTDTTASEYINYESEQQLRTLSSSFCPNRYEEIWNIIDENHLVYMNFSSLGYGLFISFDCAMVRRLLG